MLGSAFRVLFTLWAGSLWSLAVWVAPTLFYAQGDRHLAGVLVSRLFSIETYMGLAVGLLALLLPSRTKFVPGYVAAALLVVNEWLIKPEMTKAQAHGTALGLGFGPWHGISAVIYLSACVAVLVLVWKGSHR